MPCGDVKPKEKGRVYVWAHKENMRILKIGYTKDNSKTRRTHSKNHASKVTTVCGESEINFEGAFRVEKIVHKQLDEQNIHFICNYPGCETRLHKEWFEWDASDALTLLEQWGRFVQMAYDSAGIITEAARHLVKEKIHDLKPNIQELLDSLAAARADEAVQAGIRRPVLVRETGRAAWVVGKVGKRVSFLRRDEDDVFIAEPDSVSLSSDDDESLSGTGARDGAAAPATIGPHSRRNSWKDKAQSTRHFFSSLKRAAQVPSSSGKQATPYFDT
ncbi:hypothetical protein CONLIGDRAFT_483740 [Coniochaeta ligniaria NRRL 30616]|uniref:Bacteriophage T5 Orf172 DNA-binding domain-containing protein n=1 Tax=Coniochaeta ligniaria NRRL 30616 TaxID=1408157 RepID=A0A1J7JAD4_9PEZI|nr:hypothetical protein CONLIGDRAFT_483740 [Coniochaeta ligniaria NRRL 30616]